MAITTTWDPGTVSDIFQNFVSALQNGRQSGIDPKTRKAVHRAYATFASRHPIWELNLFDEDFLTREGGDTLQAFVDGHQRRSATAIALATAWSDSIGPANAIQRKRRVADATMAADTLLGRVTDELGRMAGNG